MLAFVIQQGEIILTTTQTVSAANDFLETQYGMILYNSTCMCLQTIGETLKQIDLLTQQKLLRPCYSDMPWRSIFALRNLISHEYATTDPEEIYFIIRHDLTPLLGVVKKIKNDIGNGAHDNLFTA